MWVPIPGDKPVGTRRFDGFHSLAPEAGGGASERDEQRIRDDLPIEDECINYYIKKEYCGPSETPTNLRSC
jgi:hypothetical protein